MTTKHLLIAFTFLLSLNALALTSSESRANKKFESTLQLGFDYRMATFQASVMYFLNADNLIGLKAGTISNTESQTNFALQYKHFFGNSFYMAGEGFYLRTREDVDGVILNNALHDFARYESLGAGARIGNQWTWEHFTMGCDWVGFGRRFGTFRKDTDSLNDTTITLGNFYLGASF